MWPRSFWVLQTCSTSCIGDQVPRSVKGDGLSCAESARNRGHVEPGEQLFYRDGPLGAAPRAPRVRCTWFVPRTKLVVRKLWISFRVAASSPFDISQSDREDNSETLVAGDRPVEKNIARMLELFRRSGGSVDEVLQILDMMAQAGWSTKTVGERHAVATVLTRYHHYTECTMRARALLVQARPLVAWPKDKQTFAVGFPQEAQCPCHGRYGADRAREMALKNAVIMLRGKYTLEG